MDEDIRHGEAEVRTPSPESWFARLRGAALVDPATGVWACRECGCNDLRAYRTTPTDSGKLRERRCRNCGHRVFTEEKIRQ